MNDQVVTSDAKTSRAPILALALDLDDLSQARTLAKQLSPYFRIAKVGLELFSSAGTEAVTQFIAEGFDVFLDVKLHDIPTTVQRASAVLGRVGARYVTLHTSGGTAMLRAGVEGLREGAAAVGNVPPIAIGVTVLTSTANPPVGLIEERTQIAIEGGCGGLVCAAPDLRTVRPIAPDLLLVVPGTRPLGSDLNDQARVDTPEQAVNDGADVLVIGRTVTKAPDPVRAAHELAKSLGVVTSN